MRFKAFIAALVWLFGSLPAYADVVLALPGEVITAGDSVVFSDGAVWQAGGSHSGTPGTAVQSGAPGSGAIQVSLAVIAEQSGTWNIGTVTSITNPVAVTQSGTWNINNVTGTVSLPTGAATAAKQPALGTAGTASTDVITIQGIAAMTPVAISGTVTTTPSGTQDTNLTQVAGVAVKTGAGTASGAIRVELPTDGTGLVNAAQSGTWNIGSITTLPTLPTGDNTIGRVKITDGTDVALVSAGGAILVDGSATTQPVSGTVAATQSGSWSLAANQSVNVAQMNGVAVTMGNGASGTGVQRITLASDSTGNIATIGTSVTPGTAATNLGKAEDAVAASGDTGVAAWAVRNDAATALAADGDYHPLMVNSSGALIVAASITPPALQDVNLTQVAGASVATGNGTAAGSLRVSVASDSTGQIALATGSNTIGALTANQTVDVNRLAGTATAVNNGTASAGTLRVTVASDSTGNIATIGTSVTPGTAATNLGKAEDVAAATGDTGVAILAQRNDDADTSLTSADGDYGTITVNSAGRQTVVVDQSLKPTYSAASGFYTPPATPTDCVVLRGSSTKTIKVWRVVLSQTQTTLGTNTWFLIKRSSADTGGTSVNDTEIPFDSGNAAATATLVHYTANPTLGGSVGNVTVWRQTSNALTSASAFSPYTAFDAHLTGQPIVLRGTAEQLALNFNGAALPAGLSICATMYWTEE